MLLQKLNPHNRHHCHYSLCALGINERGPADSYELTHPLDLANTSTQQYNTNEQEKCSANCSPDCAGG